MGLLRVGEQSGVQAQVRFPISYFLLSTTDAVAFDASCLVKIMAESLYASYADILSVCQGSDDPEELLDPETGFASRLRRLCDDRCVLSCPQELP